MKKKLINILWSLWNVEYVYDIAPDKFYKMIWVPTNLLWITIRNKWQRAWIYIADFTPETIAHEAFHAVYHTADLFWIKLWPDSEEWFAHSIDKIVSTIIKTNANSLNKH